jgi:hypothetical protein
VVLSILPGCRDFERRAVVQPRVRPVVVVVDVACDLCSGLVEGLELVAPDAAFLELAEPPAMKGAASLSAKWSGPEEGLGSTGLGQAVSLVGCEPDEPSGRPFRLVRLRR